MSIKILNEHEIKSLIKEFPEWSIKNNKLHREFIFKNFIHAFAFISQIAIISEKMDHHPEWSNVYNRVTINLTTHDLNGISSLDRELALKIDEVLLTQLN